MLLESTEFLPLHFPGAQAVRLPILPLKPVFACDARTLPRPIVIGLGEGCRRAACAPGIIHRRGFDHLFAEPHASRSVNPRIGVGGGKKHTDKHGQTQTDTDAAFPW